MKMTYNWLVAGMLAVAAAAPVLDMQARPSAHVQVCMTITDALAYRILEEASELLESQYGVSESADSLFQQFKGGGLSITYLGHDGVVYVFQVSYVDGPLTVSLDDF